MTDRSDRFEKDERFDGGQAEVHLEGTANERFETALAQLEEVVRLLESGELNLDDALAHFSRGIALARACNQRLRTVELEMERLLAEAAGDDGEIVQSADGAAAGA